MPQELYYIKYSDISDLVKHLLTTPQAALGGQAPINHVKLSDSHVYFTYATGAQASFVSYVELKEAIEKKYINFHRVTGKITLSDQPASEPQVATLPILEVAKTNLFDALIK